MSIRGNVRKMQVELSDPVQYTLTLVNGDEQEKVNMTALIGQEIHLHFNGEINCVACGKKTKKSFQQGHCFPCMRKLASCDGCIVRPETCHFDEGTCRDETWAKANCFQPHYVYLSNSSGLKVGITRGSQIPIRWIDQGATQAMPIFKVATRLQSGLVEVALKQYVGDRTDWRKMLKGEAEVLDMAARRDELFELSAKEIGELMSRFGDDIEMLKNEAVVDIRFPVAEYPEKVKSYNFDKDPDVEGILQGVKGQYLILEGGVINMRKFGGYNITLHS